MGKVLTAEYKGELEIGEMKIPCAVLEDGTRVLNEANIIKNFGSMGGKNYKLRNKNENGPLPLFIASKALEPFIYGVFEEEDLEPIEYTTDGKNVLKGYDATILPKVCEVWLKAREYNTLQASQLPKAMKAEILMRSLAMIGITALVDEATGYQYDRERFELQKILKAYIASEILKWQLTFTDEFYKEVYRLWGLPFIPKYIKNKPSFIGAITTKYVYDVLPDGVVEKIREVNPKTKKGYWKYKFHQFLSEEIGREHLKKQIIETTLIMRMSKTKEEFIKRFNEMYGKNLQLELDFGDDDELIEIEPKKSKFNKNLEKALEFNPDKEKKHKVEQGKLF
ncbi:P63C domain-containing protein [Aliarcobacter butzleri]|uniref:P63C domain-containing protein n=1 Tax=Aliarcobacter butzleri TaxID=28197 RepID=A0AAW7Q728_9BACT|nr:P63C domain-containing protein [Aliarcobacter butzleri]MDN5114881.1 P63C domain-containing protein [Aliarcobacter butzleri]